MVTQRGVSCVADAPFKQARSCWRGKRSGALGHGRTRAPTRRKGLSGSKLSHMPLCVPRMCTYAIHAHLACSRVSGRVQPCPAVSSRVRPCPSVSHAGSTVSLLRSLHLAIHKTHNSHEALPTQRAQVTGSVVPRTIDTPGYVSSDFAKSAPRLRAPRLRVAAQIGRRYGFRRQTRARCTRGSRHEDTSADVRLIRVHALSREAGRGVVSVQIARTAGLGSD